MKKIKLFSNYLNEYVIRYTFLRTINYVARSFGFEKNNIENMPLITGILNEKTLCGPELVQLDITNDCNSSCVGCWLHSPLLKEMKINDAEKKMNISIKKVAKTLKQLRKLRTQRIILSGGGEPFMHPKIMKIIEMIKELDLELTIITNFNLLTKEKIKRLVELKIDEVFISVWAGTPEIYVKTHPNQTKKSFEKLIKDIKYLMSLIGEEKIPKVRLLNVITNTNYNELTKMVTFGQDLEAHEIEFTIVDTIKEKTDSLLLNKKQQKKLQKQIESYKENDFTKVFGLERFKTRLEDKRLTKGHYDKALVDSIPCYVGYSYARIMANGNVIPCCKAAKHPLGNINEKSFKEIWFADKYEEFRVMAKNVKKKHLYFNKINCYKGCDNYMENKKIHTIINKLSKKEKEILTVK